MMTVLRVTFVTLFSLLIVLAMWIGWCHYAGASERICGQASYYGQESGRRTYNGEYFDGRALTAAMPSPRHIGEVWRVTDLANGRSVAVRVNDYGPAAWTHRVIDLSKAAAGVIGMIGPGHAQVCMDRLR